MIQPQRDTQGREVKAYRNTIGKPLRRWQKGRALTLYLDTREIAALQADADVKNLTISRLCRAIVKGYLRASYPQTFKGPLL